MTSLYDLVPYPTRAEPLAHPDRIAALAALHGLPRVDVRNARVLEIGCGTGEHLLSFAAACPGATCTGIDAGRVHIERAEATRRALGLPNVRFEHADISDAQLDSYDLVICWGTFSWVPESTQQAILQRIRDHLAPDGVALLSYNTLPGWHMMGMVRDMMGFHTRHTDDPVERVAKGRELIEFLRRATSGSGSALNAWMQTMAERMAEVPDAYLLHEFLAPHNHPLHFHELAELLAAHDLRFVTESRASTCALHHFPPPVQAVLQSEQELAGGSVEHLQQCMDFLRNKRFRASLLCHAAASPTDAPLHWDGLTVRGDAEELGEVVTSTRGFTMQATGDAAVLWSLLQDPTRWWSVDELATFLPPDRLYPLLTEALQADLLVPSFHPTPVATILDDRPLAFPLARHVARLQAEVPSLLHHTVPLDDDARALLADLDGTRTHDELTDRWRARLADDEALQPGAIGGALKQLQRAGLLQARDGH